jgi:hypothetical protein
LYLLFNIFMFSSVVVLFVFIVRTIRTQVIEICLN